MLNFENDYSEGAHPEILRRFAETNMEKLSAYGSDIYGEYAKKKIAEKCGIKDPGIFFLSGGTQTNQIVISAMLKNYEGVIAAETGHINYHEAGSVEAVNHKVLPLPGKEGKLSADTVKDYIETFYADANHEHMVFPGMVYISHPSEYGTLYSKKELSDLSDVCREYDIPLYMDGARLGYALVSEGNDLSLADIAKLCDVFYIGGTKCGALCGEAVVFTHNNMPAHFLNLAKRQGGLLAKGRVLSLQFDTLFTDDLYYKICKNAITTADMLRKALIEKGYKIFIETVTNQIFVVLPNDFLKKISEKAKFGFWEKYDDSHTVVRIATSWATLESEIAELISML